VGQLAANKNFCKNDKVVELVERTPLAASHEYLLRHLAGPLFSRVASVFADEKAVAYILAEPKRRQVWNAVLAAGRRHDVCHVSLENLLVQPSKNLIVAAYGACPSGYLTLLGRCGDLGLPVDFYRFWQGFLADGGCCIRQIAGSSLPLWELYRVLKNLPPELRTVAIAQRFGEHLAASRFVEIVRWMKGGQSDESVWRNVGEQLERGRSPRKILDRMLDDARCPAPYLVDARFRHLGSVKMLRDAGHRFKNCLKLDFTLEEALRGETQFYEWMGEGEPAIVSITNDMPFGWMIGSIKGVGNSDPDVETYVAITDALRDHCVVGRIGVLDMMPMV
jgi:hypothetical protein